MSGEHDAEVLMGKLGDIVRIPAPHESVIVCGDCGRSFVMAIVDGQPLLPDHKCLRDEFAMAALTGLLAAEQSMGNQKGEAAPIDAYDYADWMLRARKKKAEAK